MQFLLVLGVLAVLIPSPLMGLPMADALVFTVLANKTHEVEFRDLRATPVIPGEMFKIEGSFITKSKEPIKAADAQVSLSVQHCGFHLVDSTIPISELFSQAESKTVPTFPLLPGVSYEFSIGAKLPESIASGRYNVLITGTKNDVTLFKISATFFKFRDDAMADSASSPSKKEKIDTVPVPDGAFCANTNSALAVATTLFVLIIL
ncbi:hypothetical protein MDAP_001802 [Mitosporidium daphniae]|uniref:Uncharacterized protein n=1 Tax=Mitosporidium daphniae TaxID=1485682 RepID=A0A098VTU2_9MICR|nr:uncharacterized protein DI09_183p30 [Mitosporidium daphniae]KGG52355.1 hypothetical protein DI09_183p30 [Mitosporidium daphniae]|eukprot:XP_013238791.1 uncharacterized protein DI09_183p30 [Mitosporidium daphniae]